MAEPGDAGTKILKNTKIIVYVEEAMEDLIVVSFTFSGTLYQGVLLDASKKGAPSGVNPSLVVSADKKSAPDDGGNGDRLYAVSQRHTYMQGVENESPNNQMSSVRRPFKTFKERNVRTMRLRPRQVLCSKCRSICNENSENVQHSNATITKESSAPSIQRIAAENKEKYRLKPRSEPIASITQNNAPSNPSSPRSNGVTTTAPTILNVNSMSSRRVLRKRRANDLPSYVEEDEVSSRRKKIEKEDMTILKTSPVIKISFGPHGQGTVVKIPARSHTCEEQKSKATDLETQLSEEETKEAETNESELKHQLQDTKDASAKAAKKALKKAKKEAHRKASGLNGMSPLHKIHKNRHHKHKFKHKRRHREDTEKEKGEDGTGSDNNALVCVETRDVVCSEQFSNVDSLDDSNKSELSSSYNEIKKECLRQKLSISLKRLNAKAYTRCNPDDNSGSSQAAASDAYGASDDETNEGDEEEEEEEEEEPMEKVKPLMMRISSHNVDTCAIGNGRTMAVGDIVWGKIHGFPWWPGKVLSITVSQRDNGVLITQQAHVAWFGSSTTSYMPCNQLVPFLEYFKTRYNKKKRGPYKEAIKQATLAAQQVLRQMHASVSVVSQQA
uniref:PWWP domain-containing protein n=1 Tax=Strigamia maritima TaxID=126957 RepID=T1JG52_STRMM